MNCPHDGALLVRTRIAPGANVFACTRCAGRAVAMPVVRRQLSAAAARELWQRALRAPVAVAGTTCPSCLRPTAVVPLGGAEGVQGSFDVDVCTRCSLVWFDANEHTALPPPPDPSPAPDDGLTPEQRQQFAILQVHEMAAAARSAADEDPSLALERLPALLGLPVELHERGLAPLPWGTWLLAAAVAVSSTFAFTSPGLFAALAMVADDVWSRAAFHQLLTVFFVHGSWWHLIGNLWFLVVFGDDVEVRFGRARWLATVALATLLASIAQLLVDPTSERPCVGASGGISGLIVCYALLQPNARLGLWIGRGVYMQWVTFSARTGLLLWFALQAWLVVAQLAGTSNVAAVAHLGGALAGVGAWLAWRDRSS